MHDDARNASAASPLMAPTSRPPPTTFVSIDLASVILPLTRTVNKCTVEQQTIFWTLCPTHWHTSKKITFAAQTRNSSDNISWPTMPMTSVYVVTWPYQCCWLPRSNLATATEQRTKEFIAVADEQARHLIAATEQIQTLNDKRVQDILTLVDQQQQIAANSRVAYEQHLAQEWLRFALLQQQSTQPSKLTQNQLQCLLVLLIA